MGRCQVAIYESDITVVRSIVHKRGKKDSRVKITTDPVGGKTIG